jgi:hypothetical protein
MKRREFITLLGVAAARGERAAAGDAGDWRRALCSPPQSLLCGGAICNVRAKQ